MHQLNHQKEKEQQNLAERDVKDYYKAVYMEDKIGEEFDGIVSSVTSFGMFIELPNTVEGLSKTCKYGR